MNKDLVIGILLSLLLHGGIIFGENLFPKGKKHAAVKTDEEKTIEMVMPPEPPDEPEKVDELPDEEPIQNVMAPPSLVDMPTIVPVDAFTQQITPPPPPGLTPNKNAVTIPVVKPGANFGKGMKDLFNAADLDQPLQARVKTSPTYPSDLKRQGISGECVVEFIVDSNGNVAQAQVIRSTQREFEAPSIQAVLKWKFRPGKKGGRVVNTRCQQLLQFNVGDQ